MNTLSGLSIGRVTEITGLSRARIYAAAELAQLGAPAHFRYVGSAVFYTVAGLCQLVDALQKLGETTAAKALAPEIAKLRGVVAVPSQEMPRPARPVAPRAHWLDELEARQEDAA